MRFRTIRNCGKIGFEFKGGVNGKTKEFIKELLVETVKNCKKYHSETGDHLFIYRERQFNSAICPAINEIADCFVMQHPIRRKPRGEQSYSGRLDYWIHYKKMDFLLELKHEYYGYRKAHLIPQQISDRLAEAIHQLKNIKKDEVRRIRNSDIANKVALAVVVFYSGTRKSVNDGTKADENKIRESFKFLLGNLEDSLGSDTINVRALWMLHEDLTEEIERGKKIYVYPAVGFVGYSFDSVQL